MNAVLLHSQDYKRDRLVAAVKSCIQTICTDTNLCIEIMRGSVVIMLLFPPWRMHQTILSTGL